MYDRSPGEAKDEPLDGREGEEGISSEMQEMGRPSTYGLLRQMEHLWAQSWGKTFVRCFLRTGIGLEEAREAGLAVCSPEHLGHLTRCWEIRCHDIRGLVQATNLPLSVEQYRCFYREKLAKLGITPVPQNSKRSSRLKT